MSDLIVYCADIGSIPESMFGWARIPAGSRQDELLATSIEELVDRVAQDLVEERPVALGFEAPLFIPARDDPMSLTRARHGEGQWPWSAGAGAQVLVTGLAQGVWILARLRESAPGVSAYLDWGKFEAASKGLFL